MGKASGAQRRRGRGGIFIFFALACGYAPVRGGASHGLRVAEVKNDTAQAEAGGFFAAEFRSELAGRGELETAESAPVLAVELKALQILPTTAGSEGAAAYQVIATLAVSAGAYRDTVIGGEDYLAGVDVLGTEANRRAALRRLARTLAREAIERYDVSARLR
jgi:hypothetical protein